MRTAADSRPLQLGSGGACGRTRAGQWPPPRTAAARWPRSRGSAALAALRRGCSGATAVSWAAEARAPTCGAGVVRAGAASALRLLPVAARCRRPVHPSRVEAPEWTLGLRAAAQCVRAVERSKRRCALPARMCGIAPAGAARPLLGSPGGVGSAGRTRWRCGGAQTVVAGPKHSLAVAVAHVDAPNPTTSCAGRQF